MNKIIMLKGLVASGKSTRAKEQVENNQKMKRVNKDDLRAMLDNSRYSKANEKIVIATRNTIIQEALSNGFSIIVDDTGFNPVHEWALRTIAKECKSGFEIKFFDTPLEECILRDSKRDKPVGEEVIRNMYEQYKNQFPIKQDNSLPIAVIFDIDGTLAIMNGRSPYDYSKVSEDLLNKNVYNAYDLYASNYYEIIICSGRQSICYDDTVKRLADNNIRYSEIHMRKEGDERKDYVVKREFLEDIIKRYYVCAAFDDRDQVVRMRRDSGLSCFQVNYGDF